MKKLNLSLLVIAGVLLGSLAFTFIQGGGIKGTVSPADGAVQVVAVLGADSLKADVASGSFAFTGLKAGTYTLWVKGKAPYKDTSVPNVAVVDTAITDVGEIKLQQ